MNKEVFLRIFCSFVLSLFCLYVDNRMNFIAFLLWVTIHTEPCICRNGIAFGLVKTHSMIGINAWMRKLKLCDAWIVSGTVSGSWSGCMVELNETKWKIKESNCPRIAFGLIVKMNKQKETVCSKKQKISAHTAASKAATAAAADKTTSTPTEGQNKCLRFLFNLFFIWALLSNGFDWFLRQCLWPVLPSLRLCRIDVECMSSVGNCKAQNENKNRNSFSL